MNPRTIRFYLFVEKGIELPTQEVNILAADNRKPDYLKLNPAGQTPALGLDDGSIISETYAIMEYLEEKHPSPPLIGTTAEERAKQCACGGAVRSSISATPWCRASTTQKVSNSSRRVSAACRRPPPA